MTATRTTTPTPTPLDPPAITATANIDGSVTVGWPEIAGADFYEVERWAVGGPWVVVGVTTETTFTDPKDNVLTETEYHYRVKASAGELVRSNVAEATTEGAAPLSLAGGALGLAGLGALAYGAYRLLRGRNGGTA